MGRPYARSPRTPSGSTPGGGCGFLRITTSVGDGWAPHGARLRSQHVRFLPLAPAPVRQRLTQMLFLRRAVLVALAVAITAVARGARRPRRRRRRVPKLRCGEATVPAWGPARQR